MMVGNYDAALRDLLVAMQIASDTGAAPRVYDAVFNRLREVLERYDTTPVPPEDGEPSRHYGHGMHSFWEGHYVEAEKAFADAISLAPGNPLYWYMRAVTHRRLGNEEAAMHDALLGASAERKACLRRDGASLDINRELRRLQGNDRIWLENQRRGDPSRRTMSGLQR
jgi:tetratricopeptide (TPR) repeat protein